MFKIIIIIASLFMLTLLKADEKIYKIAVAEDFIPYSFINKNKEIDGLFVDYWKLWAKKNNHKIQFIAMPWNETLSALKNGKVDIHGGLFKSEERKKFVKYLNSFYPSTGYFYVNHKERVLSSNLNLIKNSNIGVLKGSYYESYLKKNFSNARFTSFSHLSEMLEAIYINKIDVFLDDSLMTRFRLHQSLAFGKLKKLKDFELNRWFHVGIQKENIELENIVKTGLLKISLSEIALLERKWIADVNLRSFNSTIIDFTANELNYIKNNPIVKVGVNTWKPVVFVDNNKISGISGSFLSYFSKLSGLKFEAVEASWIETISAFKNNEVDLLPAVFYSKSRKNWGLFSNNYFNISSSIFTLEENYLIKSFDSLSGKKIALVKGDARIKVIEEKFPNIIVVQTANIKDSVFKLLNKEIDALFETNIVVNSFTRDYFITNIKEVLQNEISPFTVHLLTQKNNIYLNSILNKLIANAKVYKENEIVDKWLTSNMYKNLNVIMGASKPPYSFIGKHLQGIEYDLVNKILDTKTTKINNIKAVPLEKLYEGFNKNKESDVLVTVKVKNNDGFYYSKGFIAFENIAVTRVNDKISINSIKKLQTLKVGAFKNAHKFLGEEFYKLFKPVNKRLTYIEYDSQEEQVRAFLNRDIDVIILDKNIFRWILSFQSKKHISEFKFNDIFGKPNKMEVAFRSESLRNFFDKRLFELKLTGEYQEIFDKYIKGNMKEQIELGSLSASLFAEHISYNHKKQISQIAKRIMLLPFLKGIKVFNNHNDLLFSAGHTNKNFIMEDIYFSSQQVPKKVGSVKLYFNKELFQKAIVEDRYLVPLSSFNNYKEYGSIKIIYQNLGLLEKEELFTFEEKNYIKNNPIVRFSEINYPPLSIIKQGKISGLFKDYLNLIETQTGLEFKFIKTKSMKDAKEKFKEKSLDLIPSTLNSISSTTPLGKLSQEFESFNFVIVGDNNALYSERIADLNGKILALPKDSYTYKLVRKNYPFSKILPTKSVYTSLQRVQRGDAYAFLGHFAVTINELKNNFPDLKVLGSTSDKYNHHFMLQKDNDILLSIINKSLGTIEDSTRQEIRNKWIQTTISSKIDYMLIYELILIFVILLILGIIWNYKLKSLVLKKTVELNNLIKSFDKSVIAAKLDFEGKTIYVSQEFCRKFGYTKEELIGKTHEMLRHPTLNDKRVLKELKASYKEGKNWRGDMCYLTKNNEVFWTHAKRKAEYDEKGNIIDYIHIFFDITHQKEIEKLNFELNNLLSSYDENVIASKTDDKGDIIYVSRAFCEISKYNKYELLNHNHSILRHKNTSNELYEELWETISSGNVWRGEIEDRRKDGNSYWLYTIITPEYAHNGDFLCYTSISQDITPQKHIEEGNRKIEILNTEIEETQRDVVFRMGAIAEARSNETGAHVKRVAEYSKILAVHFGLPEAESEILRQASPMHDIGKVAIPDHILKKPGKLTFEEFEVMKSHAKIGYEMLKTSDKAILKAAAIVAHEHQEKYDGSGYPRGLKGYDIHIYGRITAVADVFDALGSDRCYKKAWNDEQIFSMFKEEKGKHFDPILIDIFFEHLDEFLIIRDKFKDENN